MTGQEARARWVANNPEKARDGNIRAKARMKERIDKYKSERGCEDCYITDARVLDLHHRDGEDKVDHVNRMRCRASIAAVLQEAAKCDVLCANCHRIRHAEEDDQRRAADMQDISTPTGAPS